MITRISEVIHKWMGWCPNAQVLQNAPVYTTIAPAHNTDESPGGGAAGPGRIDRVVSLVTGSFQFLLQNKKLLWFSFILGILMLFYMGCSIALQFFSGSLMASGYSLFPNPSVILIPKESILWFVAEFFIQLITSMSIFVLAALMTCVSAASHGKTPSLIDGFSNARRHVRPLLIWSVVLATWGTALAGVVNQLNGALLPTVLAGALNLLVALFTLFVIPVVIFEDKGIAKAVLESVSLVRKMAVDSIAAFIILLLGMGVISIVGMFLAIMIGFISGNPLLTGASIFLSIGITFLSLFIVVTLFNIILFGLYTYARTEQLPGIFEKDQQMGKAFP
jgi:hypothetical protein